VVAADRKAGKDGPTGVSLVMDDNVRVLPRVDLGQGDQTVEAFLKHCSPGRDGIIDRLQILRRYAGCGLDSDRQVGVVPPVARIVVAEDSSASASDLGRLHVVCCTEAVGLAVGLANAVPGTSANSKDTTMSAGSRLTAPPLRTAQGSPPRQWIRLIPSAWRPNAIYSVHVEPSGSRRGLVLTLAQHPDQHLGACDPAPLEAHES
jgi:hypothetical protein